MFLNPEISPARFIKGLRCTHISRSTSCILHLAPLTPQLWGEPEFQSPPELGDLGGKKVSDANQRTCVYTVAFLRGAGGDLNLMGKFENTP